VTLDPLDPALPWRSVDRYLQRHGCLVGNFPAQHHPDPYLQTTGGHHASNSLHPQGRARDYSHGQGANVEAIMAVLLPLAVGNCEGGIVHLHQLFYTPMDVFVQDGQRVPDATIHAQNLDGIHQDHCHVGLAVGVSLDDLP
jgi:hypothetical protein